ncbi:MAG: hypothetical protein OXF54_22010 [Caldilineaceae bacterium]|nr:hypothetical protein [Caldilineaceae bacterium]
MKKWTVLIAVSTAMFAISACVPITAETAHVPSPENRASLQDLAQVFSKWDQHHDTSEYMDLLLHLEKCIWVAVEEEEADYTDAEIVAQIIYTVGVLKTAASFERHESFISGEIDQYAEEGFEDGERQSYQNLIWATEFCDGAQVEEEQ